MGSSQRQRLLSLFEQLSAIDRASLLSFAEFLVQRAPAEQATTAITPRDEPEPIPEPKHIPRPSEEKVVAAVKRLSQSYFMLDKREMLGVTSDLMTQHILQARDAKQVIDELEDIFQKHYQQLIQG